MTNIIDAESLGSLPFNEKDLSFYKSRNSDLITKNNKLMIALTITGIVSVIIYTMLFNANKKLNENEKINSLP